MHKKIKIMYENEKRNVQKKDFLVPIYTVQKIKSSIKDFFSQCDQIRRNLGHIY